MVTLGSGSTRENQVVQQLLAALPHASLLESKDANLGVQKLLEDNVLACRAKQANVIVSGVPGSSQCQHIASPQSAVEDSSQCIRRGRS